MAGFVPKRGFPASKVFYRSVCVSCFVMSMFYVVVCVRVLGQCAQ